MLDGFQVSLFDGEVVLNLSLRCINPESEAEIVRVRSFGRLVFSQQKGRRRLSRDFGAEMRASRLKANVRDAHCQVWARVCLWACVPLAYSLSLSYGGFSKVKVQLLLSASTSYITFPPLRFIGFHHFVWQRTEAQMEMFRNAGVPPKQKVVTFKVTDNALIKPGRHVTHYNLSRIGYVFVRVCFFVTQFFFFTDLHETLWKGWSLLLCAIFFVDPNNNLDLFNFNVVS